MTRLPWDTVPPARPRDEVLAEARSVVEPHRLHVAVTRLRDGFTPSSVSLPLPRMAHRIDRELAYADEDLAADFTAEPHEVRVWLTPVKQPRRGRRDATA